MVDKLKTQNQTLTDEQKQAAEDHQAGFEKVQQESSELQEKITRELTKKIEVIEKREQDNADATKIEHHLEVSKLKDEIKNLTDRLNAKRKSLENSGEVKSSKYPSRKARSNEARAVVDSSPESESESSFDVHFDQQLPKSKRTTKNQKDFSDSDDDTIIKVPNHIPQAARTKSSKQTATMHSFATSKAAKDASKQSKNNSAQVAKIPRSATPEKLLSFHTSFLKRASKGDLAKMIEKQCFKLNGIGKEGTQRGKQSTKQLEKYKKDDLIKICQDQEKLVQEHTEHRVKR